MICHLLQVPQIDLFQPRPLRYLFEPWAQLTHYNKTMLPRILQAPLAKMNKNELMNSTLGPMLKSGNDPSLTGSTDDSHKCVFIHHTVDRTWTMVPTDSSLISQPYLFEYIMAFHPFYVWAGRSSNTCKTELSTKSDKTKKYINYTGMACAHNVIVPVFENLMLV